MPDDRARRPVRRTSPQTRRRPRSATAVIERPAGAAARARRRQATEVLRGTRDVEPVTATAEAPAPARTPAAGPPTESATGDPNWLAPVLPQIVPSARLAPAGRIAALGSLGRREPVRLVDDGRGTSRRRTMRPRQVAVAGVVAAFLGLLLNAAALQKSEEAAPYGTGRTIALDLLGPLATIARDTGLDLPRQGLDSAFGHADGSASSSVAVDSVPPAGAPTGGLQPSDGSRPRGPEDRRGVPAPAVAAPAAAATAAPLPVRVPSAADPLRVWVGGDSVAGYLGLGMVDLAGQAGDLAVHSHYQVSTGITRPDYYDWPAHLEADMRRYDPEVVVFLAGANDDQPITTPGGSIADFATAAWTQEYSRRVGALMDRIRSEHRIVVWVGLPAMRAGDFDARMQTITGVDRAQAAQRPGVVFVDSRSALGGPGGGYTPYLPDGSGHQTLMRASDGIHLSPDGGRRLAAVVVAAIRRDLAAGG